MIRASKRHLVLVLAIGLVALLVPTVASAKAPALSMRVVQTMQTNYVVSFLMSHVDSATVEFDSHDEWSYCTRTGPRRIWCSSFYHGCDASGAFSFHSLKYYAHCSDGTVVNSAAGGPADCCRWPRTGLVRNSGCDPCELARS